MEAKELNFKGIERVNNGIFCNEGSCEELINLRHEGNTWRSVGDKLLRTDPILLRKEVATYTAFPNRKATIEKLYLHNSSKHKFAITYQALIGRTISLYGISVDNVLYPTGTVLHTFTDDEEFLSLSSLNNVLIVCTSLVKEYWLFNIETQLYEQIVIDTNIGSLYAKSRSEWNYGTGDKFFAYDNTDWSATSPLALIRQAQTAYEASNRAYNLFTGLSYFRYAIKLYDGSYAYYSDVDFADAGGDDNHFGLSGASNPKFLMHFRQNGDGTYSFKRCWFVKNCGTINLDIEVLNKANLIKLFELGIVLSVDVFMTRPINQLNFDCSKEDVRNTYLELGGCACYYSELPINKETLINELYSGTYYMVKSFNKNDIIGIDSSNKLTYNVNYESVKGLTSSVTLPAENTRNEYLFRNDYMYNRKLHLYNYLEKIFAGYKFDMDISTGINTYGNHIYGTNITQLSLRAAAARIGFNTTNVADSDIKLMAQVSYVDSFENLCVEKQVCTGENTHCGFVKLTYNYTFFVPLRLVAYPNMHNINIAYYIQMGSEKRVIYNSNMKLNNINNYSVDVNIDEGNVKYFDQYSYIKFSNVPYGGSSIGVDLDNISTIICKPANIVVGDSSGVISHLESNSFLKYNPVLIPANSLTTLGVPKKLKDKLNVENKIQLTETDNPFIYPSANNYVFGDDSTKVLSIQATVGQITETKFGMFPLYVFTSDGISTMAVGSGSIAYSTISPLNDHKLINNHTLNIGNSILYLADSGLYIIGGRDSQCISELVKGIPDSSKIIDGIMANIRTNFDCKIEDFSAVDFLEEIKESEFAYDPVHKEVLFLCEKYTYVYSIRNNEFHKITDVFSNTYNTTGETILTKEDDSSIYFYDVSKENDTIDKRSLIITKPFNLGSRQYKKVLRLILSMTIEKAISSRPNTEVWIYGTNDMLNYIPYKHVQVRSSTPMQDIFISRFFKSFNYAILVIATKQNDCYISGGQFEYDVTMGRSGIR